MSDERQDDTADHERMYRMVCSKQFDDLKIAVGKLTTEVGELNKKVFNGFETKIDKATEAVEHTDEKLELLRIDDKEAHTEIRKEVHGVSKGMFRLLIAIIVLLAGVTTNLIIGQIQHAELQNEASIERPE